MDDGAAAPARIATRFDAGARYAWRSSDSGPGVPREMRARASSSRSSRPSRPASGPASACRSATGCRIPWRQRRGRGRARRRRPLHRAPAPCGVARAHRPPRRVARLAPRAAPQPILIVDDEPDIAEILAEILADAGHRVEHRRDGRAALERIGRRRLRADPQRSRMPRARRAGPVYRALQARNPALAEPHDLRDRRHAQPGGRSASSTRSSAPISRSRSIRSSCGRPSPRLSPPSRHRNGPRWVAREASRRASESGNASFDQLADKGGREPFRLQARAAPVRSQRPRWKTRSCTAAITAKPSSAMIRNFRTWSCGSACCAS